MADYGKLVEESRDAFNQRDQDAWWRPRSATRPSARRGDVPGRVRGILGWLPARG